jgi:membrane-bound serine protease (ClpP class)
MDWYLAIAFTLIGFGVVLLAAEFFLPTGGVLVVGAVACFALAVGLILYYGTTEEAIAAVIGLSVGLPIAGGVMFYGWRRLSLRAGSASESGSATVASAPELTELEQLRGRHGRTVSFMRPSGTVDFDGRRIDALTEGMMLDPGVWVKCVDVRAGRVIVRQVEQPGDLSDMRIDELS